jgi:hypothetical protein
LQDENSGFRQRPQRLEIGQILKNRPVFAIWHMGTALALKGGEQPA